MKSSTEQVQSIFDASEIEYDFTEEYRTTEVDQINKKQTEAVPSAFDIYNMQWPAIIWPEIVNATPAKPVLLEITQKIKLNSYQFFWYDGIGFRVGTKNYQGFKEGKHLVTVACTHLKEKIETYTI